MNTIEIKLGEVSRNVVNLDSTQNVGKFQRIVNTKSQFIVNLDSILINAKSEATRNYIYDCIKSLMQGQQSVVAETISFKGEADKDACETDLLTDQTEGLLYYDKAEDTMYVAKEIAHNTMDNETAKGVIDFTFVSGGEDPDTSDAQDGDLFWIESETLFYEWDATNSELVPTTADTTKIYLSDFDDVYTYDNEDLQIIADCVVLENATQEDWDALELGEFVCDSDNGKYGEVIETEALELIDTDLKKTYLYADIKDSNKLYDVEGDALVEFVSPVDITGFANGALIVETI